MTQETLEEAAERFYGEEEIVNDYDISGYLQSAFLTGAKWQQEQDNKETKILENILDDNYDLNVQFHKIKRECIYSFATAMYNEKLTFEEWEKKHYGNYVEQPKWKQERSYSEEEVLKLVDMLFHKYSSDFRVSAQIDSKEWLEQFKKK